MRAPAMMRNPPAPPVARTIRRVYRDQIFDRALWCLRNKSTPSPISILPEGEGRKGSKKFNAGHGARVGGIAERTYQVFADGDSECRDGAGLRVSRRKAGKSHRAGP